QSPLGGRRDFRIIVFDRRRANHNGRIAKIVGRMADGHWNTFLAQLLDHVGVRGIRALYLVAELVHHLGDAGHADPADPDEVDRADVGAQRLHAGTPPANDERTRGVSTGPT